MLECENPGWIGDGYCDDMDGANTLVCSFDGGDCCILPYIDHTLCLECFCYETNQYHTPSADGKVETFFHGTILSKKILQFAALLMIILEMIIAKMTVILLFADMTVVTVVLTQLMTVIVRSVSAIKQDSSTLKLHPE
jgi:hypothetical protein